MPVFGTSAQRQSLFNGTPLASRNRLLAALPEAEYAQLAPLLRRGHLELRQTIFEYDTPVERVYFPESAVVSVVGVMGGGAAAQSAIIGNEGFVGLPVFLGADRMAAQTFCQIPGDALSLSADELRQVIARGGRLPILLGRYTQALFTLMSQSSACTRAHELRQRCARWLLLTHDRVGANDFPLTQLFLAQMLGVRRTAVTEIAAGLQREGHIVYSYGRITIRDRHGLESTACECYRIIKRELDRLVNGHDAPDPLSGVRLSDAGKSTLGDPAGS
jgi:CRP-like cAMP-binding protein